MKLYYRLLVKADRDIYFTCTSVHSSARLYLEYFFLLTFQIWRPIWVISHFKLSLMMISSMRCFVEENIFVQKGTPTYYQIEEGKKEYTDDDLDEIREEWAKYVTNFIFRS